MRLAGHRYDIAHLRTEESPVMEQFNSGAHVESDIAVTVFELPRSRDECLQKIRDKI